MIEINRVAKVVKGGRRFSFTALVVIGDEVDRVGVGYGKAREVPLAISKAVDDAKKNLFTVPKHGTTITHEILGRLRRRAGPAAARQRGHRRDRRRRRARRARARRASATCSRRASARRTRSTWRRRPSTALKQPAPSRGRRQRARQDDRGGAAVPLLAAEEAAEAPSAASVAASSEAGGRRRAPEEADGRRRPRVSTVKVTQVRSDDRAEQAPRRHAARARARPHRQVRRAQGRRPSSTACCARSRHLVAGRREGRLGHGGRAQPPQPQARAAAQGAQARRPRPGLRQGPLLRAAASRARSPAPARTRCRPASRAARCRSTCGSRSSAATRPRTRCRSAPSARTASRSTSAISTARFDAGAEVTPEALIEKGLIKNTRTDVKILGEGELTKKLTVTAHGFSASAAREDRGRRRHGAVARAKPSRSRRRQRPPAPRLRERRRTSRADAPRSPTDERGRRRSSRVFSWLANAWRVPELRRRLLFTAFDARRSTGSARGSPRPASTRSRSRTTSRAAAARSSACSTSSPAARSRSSRCSRSGSCRTSRRRSSSS